MFSLPGPDEARDALGDKVINALSGAVSKTREDLATYRTVLPGIVADHTRRGLASWLHDRVWRHTAASLDGIDNVSLVDDEVTREIWVGITYRVRVKRHDDDGLVRSFPTQTALGFALQQTLPGLEKVHLNAGYVWNEELREIGPAVLSLPAGRKSPEWMQVLPEPPAEPGRIVKIPSQPTGTPNLPAVEIEGEGALGTFGRRTV